MSDKEKIAREEALKKRLAKAEEIAKKGGK